MPARRRGGGGGAGDGTGTFNPTKSNLYPAVKAIFHPDSNAGVESDDTNKELDVAAGGAALQKATNSDIDAGTNDTKYVTPAKVERVRNALLGSVATAGNTLGKLYALIQARLTQSQVDARIASWARTGQTNPGTSAIATLRDSVAAGGNTLKKLYDLVQARLPLAGGTLTGALTLSGDATAALHAVTKRQLDAAITGGVTVNPLIDPRNEFIFFDDLTASGNTETPNVAAGSYGLVRLRPASFAWDLNNDGTADETLVNPLPDFPVPAAAGGEAMLLTDLDHVNHSFKMPRGIFEFLVFGEARSTGSSNASFRYEIVAWLGAGDPVYPSDDDWTAWTTVGLSNNVILAERRAYVQFASSGNVRIAADDTVCALLLHCERQGVQYRANSEDFPPFLPHGMSVASYGASSLPALPAAQSEAKTYKPRVAIDGTVTWVEDTGGGDVPADDFRFGTSDDAVPAAAELAITAANGTAEIAAYDGEKHVLLGRLASEADITSVTRSDDLSQTNQVGAFTKYASAVNVGGSDYSVWVSNQALTQSAAVTWTAR